MKRKFYIKSKIIFKTESHNQNTHAAISCDWMSRKL